MSLRYITLVLVLVLIALAQLGLGATTTTMLWSSTYFKVKTTSFKIVSFPIGGWLSKCCQTHRWVDNGKDLITIGCVQSQKQRDTCNQSSLTSVLSPTGALVTKWAIPTEFDYSSCVTKSTNTLDCETKYCLRFAACNSAFSPIGASYFVATVTILLLSILL